MSKQIIAGADAVSPAVSGRMAGDQRRLLILRVAMRLFSQRGFRGTTTKEIAHAAGVSEAMVFRHFATKEELYAAILDQKACAGIQFDDPDGKVVAAMRRNDDRGVFETLAYEALQHHENDTEFQRLLMHSALEEHKLAEMFWNSTVTKVYEFLGSYISDRQRTGAFRDVDPYIVVRSFLGMIIHHSLNNNLWDKGRTLIQITNEKAAQQFTDILLKGIVAHDARPAKRNGNSSDVRANAKKRQTK